MKDIKRSDFALNLIQFRKQRGFSQDDLAKLTGLSSRMIAYYETQSVNPPIDKIKIIAEALKVNISDLIDENKINNEIMNLDPRILKIAMMIKELNRNDKESIYNIIKSLHRKQKQLQEIKK